MLQLVSCMSLHTLLMITFNVVYTSIMIHLHKMMYTICETIYIPYITISLFKITKESITLSVKMIHTFICKDPHDYNDQSGLFHETQVFYGYTRL